MLLDGPLSLLVLLTSVAAVVPPPENVTVSCQNFQTTLYWNYSKQHPQTSFKLFIDEEAERKTTELHFDLTDIVWGSVKNYTGLHHVGLKAIKGSHESETVQSPTFTFNYLHTARIKCELDFPPVDLSVKRSQDEATVSFSNPQYFYRELKQLEGHRPWFDFTVFSDTEYNWRCKNEEICRFDFHCDQSQKECCIQLRGIMYDNNGYNYVLFRGIERICATDNDYLLITVAVLMLIFMTVVIVVIFIICKVRAWVMSPSTLPKALALKLPYVSMSSNGAAEPVISQLQLESHSITIIPEEEEEEEEEEEDLCETETSSAGSPPTSAGSIYMQGDLLDSSSEEEAELAYDRPHRPEVDMGVGDIVNCYSGR